MDDAARIDLPDIWRGSDWLPVPFIWKDSDGDPYDLTNFQAFVSTPHFSLNPAIIGDPQDGVTQLSLTKAQTVDLPVGQISWDWLWKFIGTPNTFFPRIFLYGFVTVRDPITEFS